MDKESSSKALGNVSRRGFALGGAAATVGAAACTGAAQARADEQGESGSAADHPASYEVYNTDVCIIGGGLAGVAAAMEAVDAGKDVIVIKKGPHGFGGPAGARLAEPLCGAGSEKSRGSAVMSLVTSPPCLARRALAAVALWLWRLSRAAAAGFVALRSALNQPPGGGLPAPQPRVTARANSKPVVTPSAARARPASRRKPR